jgi:hypothetical protein
MADAGPTRRDLQVAIDALEAQGFRPEIVAALRNKVREPDWSDLLANRHRCRVTVARIADGPRRYVERLFFRALIRDFRIARRDGHLEIELDTTGAPLGRTVTVIEFEDEANRCRRDPDRRNPDDPYLIIEGATDGR